MERGGIVSLTFDWPVGATCHITWHTIEQDVDEHGHTTVTYCEGSGRLFVLGRAPDVGLCWVPDGAHVVGPVHGHAPLVGSPQNEPSPKSVTHRVDAAGGYIGVEDDSGAISNSENTANRAFSHRLHLGGGPGAEIEARRWTELVEGWARRHVRSGQSWREEVDDPALADQLGVRALVGTRSCYGAVPASGAAPGLVCLQARVQADHRAPVRATGSWAPVLRHGEDRPVLARALREVEVWTDRTTLRPRRVREVVQRLRVEDDRNGHRTRFQTKTALRNWLWDAPHTAAF